MGLMSDKNNWRRVRHHKGGKIGTETGELTPGDLQEGEEKIVKLASGQLVKYLKFNGVLRTMPIDPLPDSDSGNYLLAENGYTDLANGIILQWGKVLTDSTVTFPRVFPTACLNVVLGKITIDSSIPRVTAITATNFAYSNSDIVNGDAYWQAIGY